MTNTVQRHDNTKAIKLKPSYDVSFMVSHEGLLERGLTEALVDQYNLTF